MAGELLPLSRTQIVIALCVYGFIASVLPVWMLLSPRGYLSSFTKIGTIFLLAAGVLIVNPEIKMPALTEFAGGGGPIIPGPLFPFCFITIACGAISGFHALISSGTTPKMVDKESDIRPDRLRRDADRRARRRDGVDRRDRDAAGGLFRDQRRRPPAYAKMTFEGQTLTPVNLRAIESAIGENVEGRTGGAVSLAVGMAHDLRRAAWDEHCSRIGTTSRSCSRRCSF